MRLFCIGGLVAALFAVSGTVIGTPPESDRRRPLDLPTGGGATEDVEEDEPETITFYGSQYEGDGFFWCLDRSCSMGWANEIATLRQETTAAIQQLSRLSEFSLVAFSTNVVPWNTQPQRATPSAKANAVTWVQSIQADGATCLAAAGVEILDIANRSHRRNRQILLLGDGQPFCGGSTESSAIQDVTSANHQRIPIHCLYISASPDGIPFFQQLANANDGTFTLVN